MLTYCVQYKKNLAISKSDNMYKQLHIKCICIEEPVTEFVPDYGKKDIMASCS